MRVLIPATLLLLVGCTTVGHNYDQTAAAAVQPGTAFTDVANRLGKPASTVTRADGSRVRVWMHGKPGSVRSVAMLFDAGDRLVRVVQESETNTR